MQTLRELLESREEWLMQRVLVYAKERDYTKYTSTLVEAWRISIEGLTEAVAEACDRYDRPPELGPDEDYVHDPIAAFGILEAQRHRERGVTLSMFLGLLKYYRQTYLDCVRDAGYPQDEGKTHERFLDRCFDRIEIGFCQEWANVTGGEQLSELRTTNREMTNEKNKYLTIFESLLDPVILVDADQHVENVNHAALELLKGTKTPGAVYYQDKRPEELLPDLLEELRGLANTDEDETRFEKTITVGAETAHFVVKLKRMLDISEKFSGTVILLEDITQRKRAEQKLAALAEELGRSNKDLEQFAYVASHDLQEPLRMVTAFGTRLGKLTAGTLDAKSSEALEQMLDGATRMRTLIDSLLSYSRLTAQTAPFSPVDLSRVLEDVLQDLSATIADSGATVDVETLPTIEAEPVLMHRLFQNLIGNAIKFRHPDVPPTVTVKLEPDRQGETNGRCRISVIDNGIGLEMAYKDKIFRPFERLHGRAEYEGTGIGLAVCKKIALHHKGTIEVHSNPNEGARFTVELPRAQEPAQTR